MTTYVFTIEGEVIAETAADAYQAVSELFDRMAEARREGALLRFDLADKVRVTLKPVTTESPGCRALFKSRVIQRTRRSFPSPTCTDRSRRPSAYAC